MFHLFTMFHCMVSIGGVDTDGVGNMLIQDYRLMMVAWLWTKMGNSLALRHRRMRGHYDVAELGDDWKMNYESRSRNEDRPIRRTEYMASVGRVPFHA